MDLRWQARRRPRPRRVRVPTLLRRASGRHPHPDAGSDALRCVRRHHGIPRGVGAAPQGLDHSRRTNDTGPLCWGIRTDFRPVRGTTGTTPARPSAYRQGVWTITFGFGPTLFRKDGKSRFGLADRQPAALQRLPHFPADKLDPLRSDGDLCVQACADDPQVAVHAVRNLARIAFGRAAMRWSQLGFGRTSSTSTSQATPRNLMGFKDGTMNVKAEDPAAVDEHVWVPTDADGRGRWLAGGSYLVVRRINMTVEIWDRQPLSEQEQVIGRTKAEGAPLTGGDEFSQPDFNLTGSDQEPIVATDAHVRLVHPSNNAGAKMLRRGYNFVDGSDGLGRMDAGLFFLAYVRDPRTQFIPIQTKLGLGDTAERVCAAHRLGPLRHPGRHRPG